MKLVIKSFIENSLLDWEGKIVSTLYVPHCNFRCPYCQNAGLILCPDKLETISWPAIKGFLVERKGWVDGICLTGGEPCLFEDSAAFIRKIRELGMMVKLDTNGGFPKVLDKLIKEKLINYIAMDIKAPLNFSSYQKSAGIKSEKVFFAVKQSIRKIMGSQIDYEFRTTVVPTLHTAKDIEEIARSIRGAKKYALQNFSPQGDILNTQFKKLKPYPKEKLDKMREAASVYVKECIVRGAN